MNLLFEIFVQSMELEREHIAREFSSLTRESVAPEVTSVDMIAFAVCEEYEGDDPNTAVWELRDFIVDYLCKKIRAMPWNDLEPRFRRCSRVLPTRHDWRAMASRAAIVARSDVLDLIMIESSKHLARWLRYRRVDRRTALGILEVFRRSQDDLGQVVASRGPVDV